MNEYIRIAITIIGSVIASSGFWAYLQAHSTHKDAQSQMLIGLAHNEIIKLGTLYLERGYILIDEYENLNDYLYVPYEKLGGNGSAKKIMDHVRKLPIYTQHPSVNQQNQNSEVQA